MSPPRRDFEAERDWFPIATLLRLAAAARADRPAPLDRSAAEAAVAPGAWEALRDAAAALAVAGRTDRTASLAAAAAADATGTGMGRMLAASVRAWWAGDADALAAASDPATWWRPGFTCTADAVADALALADRLGGARLRSRTDVATVLLRALGPATLAGLSRSCWTGWTLGQAVALVAVDGEAVGDLDVLADDPLDGDPAGRV